MNKPANQPEVNVLIDPTLICVCMVAGYYRVPADQAQLRHQLALNNPATSEDGVRAAYLLGLKARIIKLQNAKHIGALPYPAVMFLKEGGTVILNPASEKGKVRVVDPIRRSSQELNFAEAFALSNGQALL